MTLEDDTYINISLKYNTKKPWANIGYEAGFHQIELSKIQADAINLPTRPSTDTLKVIESDSIITIKIADQTT